MKLKNILSKGITFLTLMLFMGPLLAAPATILLSFIPGAPAGSLFSIAFNPGWTITADQMKDMNELIYEKTFALPGENDFHTIFTGIEHDKIIPYIGLFPMVGKSGQAKCDPDSTNIELSTAEKVWEPCTISDRLEFCWTDLEHPITVFANKIGVNAPDLSNTEFAMFIESFLPNALQEALLRFAWFADKSQAHYNDSPPGTMKNGTNLNYWNCLDGFWKQIFTIGTNDPDKRITIAKNAGASYAAQAFDSTDTTNKVVSGYLLDMIDHADERLISEPNQVLVVTRSIWNQYRRERLSVTGIELPYTRFENGMETMEAMGHTLISFPFWDRMIKAHFNNGTKYFRPHRAVFTTKANLGLGLESATAFKEFNPFYDAVSRKYYVDMMWKEDAKVIEDYLVMAAY